MAAPKHPASPHWLAPILVGLAITVSGAGVKALWDNNAINARVDERLLRLSDDLGVIGEGVASNTRRVTALEVEAAAEKERIVNIDRNVEWLRRQWTGVQPTAGP